MEGKCPTLASVQPAAISRCARSSVHRLSGRLSIMMMMMHTRWQPSWQALLSSRCLSISIRSAEMRRASLYQPQQQCKFHQSSGVHWLPFNLDSDKANLCQPKKLTTQFFRPPIFVVNGNIACSKFYTVCSVYLMITQFVIKNYRTACPRYIQRTKCH